MAGTPWHLDKVHRLAAQALIHDGRRTGPGTVEWDVSGPCSQPLTYERFSREDRPQRLRKTEIRSVFRVIMTVACRQCDNCLKARKRLWAARALSEYRAAHRSWFVTLTFAPDEWWRVERETFARYKNWDTLDLKDRVRHLDRTCYRRIQGMLKRIRANSQCRLRFMAVAEMHEGGGPAHGRLHYHMLLHEVSMFGATKRLIEAAWPHGHAKAKLAADQRAANYVTKYLAKSMLSRVRASFKYGSTDAPIPEDVLTDQAKREKPDHRPELAGEAGSILNLENSQ